MVSLVLTMPSPLASLLLLKLNCIELFDFSVIIVSIAVFFTEFSRYSFKTTCSPRSIHMMGQRARRPQCGKGAGALGAATLAHAGADVRRREDMDRSGRLNFCREQGNAREPIRRHAACLVRRHGAGQGPREEDERAQPRHDRLELAPFASPRFSISWRSARRGEKSWPMIPRWRRKKSLLSRRLSRCATISQRMKRFLADARSPPRRLVNSRRRLRPHSIPAGFPTGFSPQPAQRRRHPERKKPGSGPRPSPCKALHPPPASASPNPAERLAWPRRPR